MEEKYQVIILPEAIEDMRGIDYYISFHLNEERISAKQMARLYKSIRSLESFPERHRKVDWEPWTSLGMRKMPVGHYMIYYRVDTVSRIVKIVRVFYSGRDAESIIRNDDAEV